MTTTHVRFLLSPKTPSVHRCFVVLAVLSLSTTTVVRAQAQLTDPAVQGALTEREAVARALARAPLEDALEGEVAIEAGRARAAGAYPNPQLAYMREQTYGSLGTGEDYLSIAQTLDLGNRRGLRREAGEARARAAQSEGDTARLEVAAEARRRFYDVLARQRRVQAVREWVGRIEQALAIVTRREQGGDAATYERRRLERERTVTAAQLELELAGLDRAEARLRAFIGPDVTTVSGTLLPEADPPVLATLRETGRSRPDLLALDLRLEAAELEASAAGRWWAPDLRLEAGWKGVGMGALGRTDGFLLGASLSIPLWDRSTGLAQIAEGEARAARGRRALLESELDAELEGSRAETVRLRRAATELGEASAAASSDIVRIASAGYAGGELGLLELLDAYRGATDDALSVLEMELAARRARIELDRLTGAAIP
jgi:cobalt-zinc-cadmium efflux system outer membrane protein